MARLVVNPGSQTAWEIQLNPGVNTIGRGFANDFKIPDPSVSTSHCQITVDKGRTTLKDLGSTNGTFVNRAPVTEAPLQQGQTIHLGGVEMLFHTDAPTAIRVNLGPPPAIEAPPPPLPEAVPTAAPLTSTGSQYCKFHPKTLARYLCHQCQLGFCDLCVTTRPVGGAAHKFCRRCGSECVTAQIQIPRPEGPQSFYGKLPGVFAYPVVGSGVFVLIVCTIVISALDFISAGWLAIFAKMIFFGYLFSFMQNIIHSTAAGDKEMPGWPPADNLFGCFLRFLVAAVFAFGPYLILQSITLFQEFSSLASSDSSSSGLDHQEPWAAPPEILIATQILGCLYFPMALLSVAMRDSPLAANPLAVVPAIFKAPLEYLVTVVVLAVVMWLRSAGGPMIHAIFPRELTTHSMPKLFAYLGARGLWGFIGVYLLAVNMRILGLFYLTKKEKLAWFER